jgi:transposase-like protein
MIPLDVFGSESLAANLLQQVRWRDGVSCSIAAVLTKRQLWGVSTLFCKNCDRTFNDKMVTIFAHSKVVLRKWLFSICAFLRFNTSLRQLQRDIGVTYKMMHRRVKRFTRALNTPELNLVGPVEIDEVYVSTGLKGRERDQPSRSRGSVYARTRFVPGRQATGLRHR